MIHNTKPAGNVVTSTTSLDKHSAVGAFLPIFFLCQIEKLLIQLFFILFHPLEFLTFLPSMPRSLTMCTKSPMTRGTLSTGGNFSSLIHQQNRTILKRAVSLLRPKNQRLTSQTFPSINDITRQDGTQIFRLKFHITVGVWTNDLENTLMYLSHHVF